MQKLRMPSSQIKPTLNTGLLRRLQNHEDPIYFSSMAYYDKYATAIEAKHLQNSQEEMNTKSVLKRLMFLAIKREHRCKCLITFASIPCLGDIENKCIARNQQLNQDLGRGVRKQSNARIYCYSWQLWAKICRTKALLSSYIFNGHSCLHAYQSYNFLELILLCFASLRFASLRFALLCCLFVDSEWHV